MSEANQAYTIEIRLRAITQLFNSLDPSPFYAKDLDPDAEEFIVGWAREAAPASALRLRVHLPAEETNTAEAHGIPQALANYFAYRAERSELELRELFREGRRALSVGLPILVVCLVGSQMLGALLGAHAITRLIEESLILLGWVANWTPIELFLYAWWPIARRRDLYRRLATAEVRTVPYHDDNRA